MTDKKPTESIEQLKASFTIELLTIGLRDLERFGSADPVKATLYGIIEQYKKEYMETYFPKEEPKSD
jgi:hypothetical protein